MKLLSVVFLLCLCAHHAFATVEFSGNVTNAAATIGNYNLQFRRVSLYEFNSTVLPPAGGFLFVSESLLTANHRRAIEDVEDVEDVEEAQKKKSKPTTTAIPSVPDDNGRTKAVTLVGGASVSGAGYFTTYLGGFALGDTNIGGFRGLSSDISTTLGFVISALYAIQEVDSNGNSVANTSLAGLSWVFSNVASDSTNQLYSIVATGANSTSGLSITVTFLFSSVVGRANLANAVVTPKTIESVVSISGYTLANPSNSMSLLFLVATGTARVATGSGLFSGTSFTSGNYSDGSQVFFALSNTCQVGGVQVGVTVSSTSLSLSDKTYNKLPAFAGVRNRYSSKMSLNMFTVTFPAGVTDVTYDPTIGSGQVVTQASTDTNTPAPTSPAHSLTTPLASSLLLVLAVLCYFM